MQLLHSIRTLDGNLLKLSPLYAEELWRTTGSPEALKALQQVTQALPVGNNIIHNRTEHIH